VDFGGFVIVVEVLVGDPFVALRILYTLSTCLDAAKEEK